MKEERLTFHNEKASSLTLWLEPWGMPVTVPSGATVDVVFSGPADGNAEIVVGNDPSTLTLYGWVGSWVQVLEGETVRYSAIGGLPVPDVPGGGRSAVRFVERMFGG